MQSKITTLTRQCDGCPASISLIEGATISEAQAIEIGGWLTVIQECPTPEGFIPDARHFCTSTCAIAYLGKQEKELLDAESRVLATRVSDNSPSPNLSANLSAWRSAEAGWPEREIISSTQDDRPNLAALREIANA